jgi:hypothetical protein
MAADVLFPNIPPDMRKTMSLLTELRNLNLRVLYKDVAPHGADDFARLRGCRKLLRSGIVV